MKILNESRRPEWRRISTIIIVGCLTSLCVGLIGHPWLTTTFLGTLLSVLLAFAWQANAKRGTSSPTLLETPFYLAHDAEVFDRYRKLAQEMLRISGHADPIYRKCALELLDKSLSEISIVGDGRIVFRDTETWRLVYEKLLRDPSATVYRSVALVRDPGYWQDGAGSQSMKLNFELIAQSIVTIERTVILSDELWPVDRDLPMEAMRQWVHEQFVQGIWIRLVRESALKQEPELVRDMGIYGFNAVGYQEFDNDHLRTRKFSLDFDFTEVRNAETRWNRLNVYASSYKDLLDQFRLTE